MCNRRYSHVYTGHSCPTFHPEFHQSPPNAMSHRRITVFGAKAHTTPAALPHSKIRSPTLTPNTPTCGTLSLDQKNPHRSIRQPPVRTSRTSPWNHRPSVTTTTSSHSPHTHTHARRRNSLAALTYTLPLSLSHLRLCLSTGKTHIPLLPPLLLQPTIPRLSFSRVQLAGLSGPTSVAPLSTRLSSYVACCAAGATPACYLGLWRTLLPTHSVVASVERPLQPALSLDTLVLSSLARGRTISVAVSSARRATWCSARLSLCLVCAKCEESV